MDARTRLGLGVIGVAVTLGALFDALLRSFPWGLNFSLCVVAFGVAFYTLVRRHSADVRTRAPWFPIPLFLFAALCMWRDSPVLFGLNALAIFLTLGLLMWNGLGGDVRRAGVLEYACAAALNVAFSLFGPFMLAFHDIAWSRLPRGAWTRHAVAVVRGVAIAAPLLLIFGALFASADAQFSRLAGRFFSFNPEEIVSHGFLISLFAWLIGGFLRGALMTQPPASSPLRRLENISLGFIETVIALGSMNVLFLAFTLVQARYLFGGALHVRAVSSLTYSAYARSGFYELVAVVVLTLPILLAFDWLLRRENPTQTKIFTGMAALHVGLLFVIMISALYRMRLLQTEYGMTELRFYSTAFMFWLAAVFVIFALTVLRGRREKFAFHAILAGFVLIVVLNIMNPDNVILTSNLRRTETGAKFDATYVRRLSADAVPTLTRVFPQLSPTDQEEIGDYLFAAWLPPNARDWRSFSISRTVAWRAVQMHEAQFKTFHETRAQRRLRALEDAQRRITEIPTPSDASPASTLTPPTGPQPNAGAEADPPSATER
jgi:hypothetical protein